MLKEIFDFVISIVSDWSIDRVVILFVGVIVGSLGLLKIGTWMNWFASPWRIKSLEREKAALTQELKVTSESFKHEQGRNATCMDLIESDRKRHELDTNAFKDRLEVLSKKKDELAAEVEKWHDVADRLTASQSEDRKLISLLRLKGRQVFAQLRVSEQHNLDILNQDGQFWERPPEDKVPPFRPRVVGSASIIAVMNLKGGVGKTTLTSNLGYTLAKQGLRVLLVDADHQATLTTMCLSEIQVRDARLGEGRLVNNLFKLPAGLADAAFRNLTAINGLPDCSIMAASSSLLQTEEMCKARWLIQSHSHDVRYLFREAFHSSLFQTRFDVILIDCPPRPTPACINALTAADHLLIPTLLDKPSVDAIPNLLGWIKVLKRNKVCSNLELLGVVGNRSSMKTKLSKREADLWKRLEERCRDQWDQPLRQFQKIIPQRACFADAAEKRFFAASADELQPIFQAFAKEFLSLQVIHEHRKPANLPA